MYKEELNFDLNELETIPEQSKQENMSNYMETDQIDWLSGSSAKAYQQIMQERRVSQK